jgi:hypothetical protein
MGRAPIKIIVLSVAMLAIVSWLFLPDTDGQIMDKLKSKRPITIILAAREAADEQNELFVPQLLKDATNPSVSTNLRSYGTSVYTACMYSLQQILQVKPPHKFSDPASSPDTENIRFYTVYWQLHQKRIANKK